MKALLTTLFFLTLMASMTARWMDGLLDGAMITRCIEHGLEERRRDWGRYQLRLYRNANHNLPITSGEGARLPLGALFRANVVEGDAQLAWIQGLLARLCQACHPDLLSQERETLAMIRMMMHHIVESRQPGTVTHKDGWSSFTGKITCNEDLMALPLPDEFRHIWQALLVGAPPSQNALLDWIDIESYQPAPLEALPPQIVHAIFGDKGAQSIMKLRPELREAALSNWLDPNAQQAVQRLVDYSGPDERDADSGIFDDPMEFPD